MSNPVKIQINSLEALQRLIGGDSHLEIEIRNSIVQEFSKKYLKAVANSNGVQYAERLIKDMIKDHKNIHGNSYGIKPELAKLIQESVRSRIYDVIRETIKEYLDSSTLKADIERIKSSQLDRLEESINTRGLDNIVNQEIRKRLNLDNE